MQDFLYTCFVCECLEVGQAQPQFHLGVSPESYTCNLQPVTYSLQPHLVPTWEPCWATLGPLGRQVGATWCQLGSHVGPPSGTKWHILATLGFTVAHLGRQVEPFGSPWGAMWSPLAPHGEPWGANWWPLGTHRPRIRHPSAPHRPRISFKGSSVASPQLSSFTLSDLSETRQIPPS